MDAFSPRILTGLHSQIQPTPSLLPTGYMITSTDQIAYAPLETFVIPKGEGEKNPALKN